MSAQRFRLVAVSDNQGDFQRIERICLAAADGGLAAICLREPDLSARHLAVLVRRLIEKLRPLGVSVLVSDRVDIAVAAGADGVQLGFRSIPLDKARRMIQPPMLIGVSAHEGDDLQELAARGADYAFYGPVFETPSKRGWRNAVGVEKLEEAARSTTLPLLAIGGLEQNNVRGFARGPLAGMAVVRSIFEAPDPAIAARALLEVAMMERE